MNAPIEGLRLSSRATAADALASATDVIVAPKAEEAPKVEETPKEEPKPEPVTEPVKEPEAKVEPVAEPAAAKSEAEMQAAGRAEMHERITTVFASEHVAGREAAAAELLAADLSADRIVATLGKLPKGGSADMLAGIRAATANPNLGAGGESEPDTAKAAAGTWGRVFDRQGWNPNK